MLTALKMQEIACVVEAVAIHRLRNHVKKSNLITYEGTVLDRLCLHFARQAWQSTDYTVICSVRPCMDTRLQMEVKEFAQNNGYSFVGFDSDCEVDQEKMRFVSIRCDNISGVINDHLKGRDGLLVLSGLLNGWSQSYFQALNTVIESFSNTSSTSLHILNSGPKSNADWQTLFVFEGFYPIDILATYFYKVSLELEPHHIPTCYLSCHNEEQQESLQNRLMEMRQLVISGH